MSKVKDVGVQWDPLWDRDSDSGMALSPGLVRVKSRLSARREVGVQCDRAETTETAVQVDLITQALTGDSMQLQCVSVRADEPQGGALLQHCPKPRPRGRPRGRPRLNRDQTGTQPDSETRDQTGTKAEPSDPRAIEPDRTRTKTWTRTRQIRPSRRYQDYELHESPERRRKRTEEEEGGHEEEEEEEEQRRNGHDPRWRPANHGALRDSVSHDALVRVKEEAGLASAGGVVCDICGKVLRNKSSLSRHSLVHEGARPHGCKYCPLRFNRKDNLRNHLRLMHPNGPAPRLKLRPSPLWLCHTCGKTFSCRSRLQTHEEIHSGIKPCPCPLCPKAYMRVNDLKHHLKTVHPNGTASPPAPPLLLCHLCGRSFGCKSLLSLHLAQSHGGERPHQCRVCGRKFSRKHQLTVHSATVHRGEELQERQETGVEEGDSFVCDTCGRRLKSSASLVAHLKVHCGEKPFHCEVCGRGFITELSLSKHKDQVHLRSKPAARASSGPAPPRPCSYPCAVCGRSFRFRSLLLAHAAVHSEERPFRCELCPRSFRRRSHLSRHTEALHPDGRPRPRHHCPVCGTDQKYSSRLQRHLLTHSGERPHTCDRCGQTFSRLGNLQQHQTRIHGDHIQRRRRGYEDTPHIVFSDDDDDDGDRQNPGRPADFKQEAEPRGPADEVTAHAVVGEHNYGETLGREGAGTGDEAAGTGDMGAGTGDMGAGTGEDMRVAEDVLMKTALGRHGGDKMATGEETTKEAGAVGAGTGEMEAGTGEMEAGTGENVTVDEHFLMQPALGRQEGHKMATGEETMMEPGFLRAGTGEEVTVDPGEVEEAGTGVIGAGTGEQRLEAGVEGAGTDEERAEVTVEEPGQVEEAGTGGVGAGTGVEVEEVVVLTADGDMLVAQEVHVLMEEVELL